MFLNDKLTDSGFSIVIHPTVLVSNSGARIGAVLEDVSDWLFALQKILEKRGERIEVVRNGGIIKLNNEIVFLLRAGKRWAEKKQNMKLIKTIIAKHNVDEVLTEVKSEFEKIKKKRELERVDDDIVRRIKKAIKKGNIKIRKYKWEKGEWQFCYERAEKIDFRGKSIKYSKEFEAFVVEHITEFETSIYVIDNAVVCEFIDILI